ncbi:MAG: FtsH protease activity modulator HflK [Sphaerochaetaceae bacterium]|jgi:membrane protease subunit HflK|nr:FtsH protease activity modulator HflK [Sphaerochaetaceae bacterium]
MAFTFYENSQQEPKQGERPRTSRRKPSFSPKLIWAVLAAIVLIAVLSTSFFVVDQTEQAVVLRFGKYIKTVGPGLQTKLPLGIDQNYNIPTQVVQTMTFGYNVASSKNAYTTIYDNTDVNNESMMLTGDLNIIDLEWIVQYKIENPYQWLFSVEYKEQTIKDVSRSVLNQLVGNLPILSIMTSERTAIEIEAQQLMQEIFNKYNFGVKVVTVKLQNIVPPEGDVQDAFEDVNKAIQDMNRLINEGKQNYNSEIPAAQGEANQLIQQAQGYAAERVNTAKGDVARFNSVREAYETTKSVTAVRLYLETMEEIFSKATNLTVIDKNLDNFLPISQIGGAK